MRRRRRVADFRSRHRAFDPANACQHHLLRRWRHYENGFDYRRLFDAETADLTRRIFDTDQELERRLLDGSLVDVAAEAKAC